MKYESLLAVSNRMSTCISYKVNNYRRDTIMSDSGFACPKCDLVFTTAEDVARHLKNEHVDGSQTERLRL